MESNKKGIVSEAVSKTKSATNDLNQFKSYLENAIPHINENTISIEGTEGPKLRSVDETINLIQTLKLFSERRYSRTNTSFKSIETELYGHALYQHKPAERMIELIELAAQIFFTKYYSHGKGDGEKIIMNKDEIPPEFTRSIKSNRESRKKYNEIKKIVEEKGGKPMVQDFKHNLTERLKKMKEEKNKTKTNKKTERITLR